MADCKHIWVLGNTERPNKMVEALLSLVLPKNAFRPLIRILVSLRQVRGTGGRGVKFHVFPWCTTQLLVALASAGAALEP